MQLTMAAGALLALGSFVNDAMAATTNAQQAMDSFLSKYPVRTRSATQSKTTDLASLKAAALAGNFTLSSTWQTVHQSCPGSCLDLGLNSSAWPVYSQMDRLAKCDEPMLLDFALDTPIDGANGHVSIRGCTADLNTPSTYTTSGSCSVPKATVNATSTLQLTWGSSGGDISSYDAVAALEQLYAYELTNTAPCDEAINFAYSGSVAVGLYMGSGLHGQSLLAPVLNDLIQRVSDEGLSGALAAQLCNEHSARYAMGVYISSSEDMAEAQTAVQGWRNSTCVSSLGQKEAWNIMRYSVAAPVGHNSTSHSLRSLHKKEASRLQKRDTECTTIQVVADDTCTTLAAECGITAADFTTYNSDSTLCSTLIAGQWVCCSSGTLPDYSPSPDSDGNCYSHLVLKNDTCDYLAASYDLTSTEIDSYNTDTWGYIGCADLLAGEYICLSSGYPPMPSVITNAVCGPQVNGTATAPHGTDLSTLNPCPLNACCDIWGQCGITDEFCTITNSTTGNPGTAANNTNGCISNCGTDIIQSDAPSEVFQIGYFEAFDLTRPCMRTWIDDMDLSPYTHIHLSFATLNSDYSYDISMVEEQLSAFVSLTDVKRIISVGGWDFSTDASTYDIFREAVASDANRQTLVSNTIAFLNKYDFDGVDWDWEYPGEPDIPGIPADTDDSATNFFLFLLELHTAMASQVPEKTLSTTAPSSFWYLKAFPIEAISSVVDYIVLMTYDMHGQWDWNSTWADPGCPDGSCLRSHVNLTETLSALSMITKAGVSSNQVAVGVASYARSFQMTEAGCYGPECTFVGPDSGATPGECTDTAGYISNAELASVMEDEDVYTFIDDDSNSNIMVWNETQWAAWMDDDIKSTRKDLYTSMNFLGWADWAIDLQSDNDTTGSDSSGTTSCEISIDPSVWTEDSPTVTAADGCTLIWPPMPLSTTTTISFPGWATHLTWRSAVAKTLTFADDSTLSYNSYSHYTIPTILSIPAVQTNAIPVWDQVPSSGQTVLYQTSSVLPSPFAVVMTPTVGGTTTVIGGTTSTISGFTFASGNYTYSTPSWVGVFGGTTSVVNGTVLPETTTTVTPHPYPTTTNSTPDPSVNPVTTHRSSSTTSGGSSGPTCVPSLLVTCGKGCAPFCIRGCPLCPPDGGGSSSGGSGSGSGSGDDDDDDSSSSTSTSTETGSVIEAPALATRIAEDWFPTTTDALSDLKALASAERAWMISAVGTAVPTDEPDDTTATNKATGTAGVVTATATASTSTATLGCSLYQDPDSGSSGTYCSCPDYDGTLPTLSGSDKCAYTALPTSTTTKAPATTKDSNPYPYTFTDFYGVVVACESVSYLDALGSTFTYCSGSRTTEKSVTITVTEVLTTSVMSNLCGAEGYYACVLNFEKQMMHLCPKTPRGQKVCEENVFEQAQVECETLCTFTASSYTTTYTALAP